MFENELLHQAGTSMIQPSARQVALEWSPPPLARVGRTVHAAAEERVLQVSDYW